MVRIDLHTHSSVSDGTDRPAEVIRAAAASGLDVVALTDHDTTDSWDEAVAAAADAGIRLVRGIELSTKEGTDPVHLLAYLPDPTHEPLIEMMREIREGREARVPRVVARLRELGSAITVDDVHRLSHDASAVGRPHIADALVTLGEVADRDQAFDRFLGYGRPAYVERYAPQLPDALRVVEEAGGAAVLAHPWGRQSRDALTRGRLEELAGLGLAGLEVDHQDHGPAERGELREIARGLGLVATGSSDYHGTGKTDHGLGCNLTEPDQLEALLQRAAEAGRRAGRAVPVLV